MQDMNQIKWYKDHELYDYLVFYYDGDLYRLMKDDNLYYMPRDNRGRYKLNIYEGQKRIIVILDMDYIKAHLPAYQHPVPDDPLKPRHEQFEFNDKSWLVEDFITQFNLREPNGPASIQIDDHTVFREDMIMKLINMGCWINEVDDEPLNIYENLVKVSPDRLPTIRQNMCQINWYKGYIVYDRQLFYYEHQFYRIKQDVLYLVNKYQSEHYRLIVKEGDKWIMLILDMDYIEAHLPAYKQPVPGALDSPNQARMTINYKEWVVKDFVAKFNLRDPIGLATIQTDDDLIWREELIMMMIKANLWTIAKSEMDVYKYTLKVPEDDLPTITQNMVQIRFYKCYDLHECHVFYYRRWFYRMKEDGLYRMHRDIDYHSKIDVCDNNVWTTLTLDMNYIKEYKVAYKQPFQSDPPKVSDIDLSDPNKAYVQMGDARLPREVVIKRLIEHGKW
jgi:hypothetical protein